MEEENYLIKLHPDAVKSIEQIYFITSQASLLGALHVVDDIYAAIDSLRINPERFQYDFDLEFPYRRILVRQYKIIFIIDEKVHDVMVLLVWNTKTNPPAYSCPFGKNNP